MAVAEGGIVPSVGIERMGRGNGSVAMVEGILPALAVEMMRSPGVITVVMRALMVEITALAVLEAAVSPAVVA